MSVVFVLGAMLVIGALGLTYVAVAGVPGGRVSRDRVAEYAVVEHKPVLTKAADATVARVETLLSERGWRPFRAEELEIAGVKSSVASLVVAVSCFGVGVAVLLVLLGQNLLVALVAGALVPVVAKVVVRLKAGRRRKKFANQLAPLLQMLAASLRAGHSMPKAMDAASRDAESPMAEELSRVVNEYRIGRDLVEAMEQVSVRMQSVDFLWITHAIESQRETGGNLNEILDQVAETIRDRQHIRMQVHALSAEGRLSAWILMALPVAIGIYYSFVSADRMSLFVASGVGKLVLLGCALAYVIGGFWMRNIVRIEF